MADSRYVGRNPDCAYRVIDGEALIVKVAGEEGNRVFTLNRSGTVVWELADGGLTSAEISERLKERFEVPDTGCVTGDIDEFIDDLVQRGMVVTASQPL